MHNDNGRSLEKNKENKNLLDMDGLQRSERIRQLDDREEKMESPPIDLCTNGETPATNGARVSQVRQSSLCEPGTHISGDVQRQHEGLNKKGKTAKWNDGEEDLQAGTRASGGDDLRDDAKESREKSLQDMRKNKGDELPKTNGNKTALVAKEDGTLVGASFEEQYRLAKAYHASGIMPTALNSAEKVLVAIQLCRELALPPMTSIGKICIINGTPSLFGDLPLALVMKSGKLEKFKETFEKDESGNIIGATCLVKRSGMDEITREFWISDAKNAGLLNRGPWKAYPKRMLQMRSRTWALKDTFPDVLSGISIAEWDANALMDGGKIIGESETKSAIAQEINQEYSDVQEGQERISCS